jgi:predicted DNA-binding mobile mystery protein A
MAKKTTSGRAYLDARLERLALVVEEPNPRRGWIREIRDALGMSSTDLAGRLGTSQSSVSELERSEVHDSIKLGSLRRVADALDCDLFYFLAPRSTLDDAVRTQARQQAERLLASDEGRGGDDRTVEDLTASLIDSPGLWSEAGRAATNRTTG